MSDATEFASRFAAQWNEPDAELRRASIAELWAKDCAHFTDTREFRGHEAMFDRITEAYEQFVGTGKYQFVSAGNAVGHHDGIKFNWHMVSSADGTIAAVGFDFVVLDADGRIGLDYQFNEPS
ncbi:hypothetical protein F0L68_32065 [Solihabitans fulvus]|uniref:SnoaL-like domain-containing protein n=1 Tax=Solihabitans fulvus TaxID=1892852 RepID=A0A5B2WVH7_9PSEU|nr:hypothetical protein [Solihabitans fulvus]KAA2253907.1 hypothetical protein F0L68_32065 [Solihabitans fulvus]